MKSDFLNSDIGASIQNFLQAFSHEDDLSDVSVYYQRKNPASVTDYVLLDVSDGPKTVLQLCAFGYMVRTTGDLWNRLGPVTVDGTANSVYPSSDPYIPQNDAGDYINTVVGYPIRYDSSFKVEWRHNGSDYYVLVYSVILGSGPHSIAVVKDGEPVYMTAENLSEETIEGMNVPSGYKIVRDPDIAHEDAQNRGMWDDSKEEVVDHPYWKPFHDTLDRLNEMASRTRIQDVLDEIDKNPTSFENLLGGELPKEDPLEEAIQFWKEREEERTSELSLSDIRKG